MAIIPTVSTDCYTSSYSLHRSSDGANMETIFSSIVSQSGSEFELQLSDTDYTHRHDLWDSGTDYYIRRVLTGIEDTSDS